MLPGSSSEHPPDRRPLAALAACALLVGLLAARCSRPREGPDRPAAEAQLPAGARSSPSPARPPTPPARSAPAPTTEAPALPAWELAEAAISRQRGEIRVDCPLSRGVFVDAPGGDRYSAVVPGRVRFTTPHPDGVALGEAQVLRWRTDPAGVTTCVEEPLEREVARLRLVDADGAPVQAWVRLDERRGETLRTGPDGVARIPVHNGGPRRVSLAWEEPAPWRNETRWLRPGDDLTWVLHPHPDGWSLLDQARWDHLAWLREHEAAANALLRDPNLDPALRDGIREVRDGLWEHALPPLEEHFGEDDRPLPLGPPVAEPE